MAKKFYAVRNGRKTGIYTSWDKCKEQIMRFSGAVYKGFDSECEALKFLNAKPAPPEIPKDDTAAVSLDDKAALSLNDTAALSLNDTAVAYIDGSYSNATKEYSCGVVIFYKNMDLRLSEKFSDPRYSEMRNVAGEIMGAEKAMRYCLENGIKRLEIVHDYEGIARWCTGQWQARKPATKAYKAFYDSLAGRLNVTFRKVKSHSGDTYNDTADQLARSALEITNG